MDRWKSRDGKSQRGEEKKKENQKRESLRRKKIQVREKVGKSRNTVFFQWFVAPEGRKSRLAKAAGAEPAGQMRDEKLHAVVARSTFPSQNVQSTTTSDHFWKLWCRKSARRCGAKHICKSKCAKHLSVGPLLEVAMSKKCTPLWREARLQVKKLKTPHVRNTVGRWDVEKVRAVVARSTFPSQNVKQHTMFRPLLEVAMSKKCTPLWREAHFQVNSQHIKNTRGSDHFWTFRCAFAWQAHGIVNLVKSEQNVRVL